ncbi:hypothetical protein HPP92_001108 [Vanilla planifolia]|uniref:Uncharacterized protein n=1 Tax=Vanilla planifolia TaxID=51239 RepID=A0A835RQS6_VANPL|nr:hypothetical protein HPP92_001272 [Vanilla planifolia]KAG0501036.1 hypothetical protein HPP92_001108 [Vanilla planifolia]
MTSGAKRTPKRDGKDWWATGGEEEAEGWVGGDECRSLRRLPALKFAINVVSRLKTM